MSRSGYYKWHAYAARPEKDYNDYQLIKELFDKGKGKYGWRTLQMKLRAHKGIRMNHKKILRIKSKYNLVTKIRRRNPYKDIMKKTTAHRTFQNILDRNFTQPSPYSVFCTDITYLPFQNKMIYLSVVKDIASREIVAWEIASHLGMGIALNTIERMKNSLSVTQLKNAMIHSDQGSHYTNPEYIRKIRELKMIQSMSRKGSCIDNAPIESFFGHLKDDIDYQHCKTFEEVHRVIEGYIRYYNNERQQWNLKKMTPVAYRNHLLANRA